MDCGLSVKDLQNYFGFEAPRAIYKWQKGEALPSVDNLYALGILFEVPMDQILVPTKKLNIQRGQQAETCCSGFFGSIITTPGVTVLEFAIISGFSTPFMLHFSSAFLPSP